MTISWKSTKEDTKAASLPWPKREIIMEYRHKYFAYTSNNSVKRSTWGTSLNDLHIDLYIDINTAAEDSAHQLY